MDIRTVTITDELELWTYPSGRVVLHVQVRATEGPDPFAMFGEVNVPDVAELVRKLQAATPAPIVAGARWLEAFLHQDQPGREPVTHEATDPEWDEAATEYVLACTCGTWETRGTPEEITAEWGRHLDEMGVPANDLALQEITITPGPELAAAINAQRVPEAVIISRTGGGFNWNRIILAVLATQAPEPEIKAEAYAALHKAQDELIAEILASRTAGPIRVSAAGPEVILHRMSPGDRAELAGLLEIDVEREAARLGAEAVDALGDVAEAMGMDRQSVISHTPAELGRMVVAIIRHRERVKRATELSRAVAQFPEILATAAPELRQALRTMLADAADALAEPEPTEVWHREAAAAGGATAGISPRWRSPGAGAV